MAQLSEMHTHIRVATIEDSTSVAHIGRLAVELSHRDSCSVEDMNHFLDTHYNEDAIKQELGDAANIYHILCHNNEPVGFSKIILNAQHPRIASPNTTKLDRIYLLSDHYGQNLGRELLNRNIELSKENGQCGMWLFTWQGNERAINFYKRNGFTIIGDHRFKVSETHYNPHWQMLLSY